jgi:hypothetical protein
MSFAKGGEEKMRRGERGGRRLLGWRAEAVKAAPAGAALHIGLGRVWVVKAGRFVADS